MAFDAHKNLAISAVATAPSPAASGTSLVVTAGEGVRMPAVPFNATVWPIGALATPANAEVVRVTARTTDTLTITRAQEGTSARTIVVGDLIAATITAKTLTDVEALTPTAIGTWTPVLGGDGGTPTGQAYSFQSGNYVKIGPVVVAFAVTTLTAKGTTPGANLQLKGLPFPAAGTMWYSAPSTHWKFVTPAWTVGGLLLGGDSALYLRGSGASGDMNTNLPISELANDSSVALTIVYLTTS